jgi:hypothetical protein
MLIQTNGIVVIFMFVSDTGNKFTSTTNDYANWYNGHIDSQVADVANNKYRSIVRFKR